jgi:hypothetical protein
MPTEQEIRERAHAIWEAEGRPAGREWEHWNQAARELGAAPADLSAEQSHSFEAERQGSGSGIREIEREAVAGAGAALLADPHDNTQPAAAREAKARKEANRPAGRAPDGAAE